MKLSGGFSEMSDNLKQASPTQIFQGIMPWLTSILASFGPGKTMFGSDWPVCTVGMEGEGKAESAWGKWRDVVEKICYMASMDRQAQEWLWYRSAMEAYGIEEHN